MPSKLASRGRYLPNQPLLLMMQEQGKAIVWDELHCRGFYAYDAAHRSALVQNRALLQTLQVIKLLKWVRAHPEVKMPTYSPRLPAWVRLG